LWRRHLSLATVCVLLTGVGSHEGSYPTDYFRSPLGIPLRLSSSFAEMRTNAFHSGLDLKTNGREGYRIYAAAEGWIYRIKVSAGGYGNALYVRHPGGYASVYAHMQSFKANIAALVRREQLRAQSFEIDRYFEGDELRVEQGEVLGLSGNTGSSTGPHLHFEIRDARTEWPINPILFGFDVPDTRPPRIFRVKVYPLGDTSYVRIERTNGQITTTAAPIVLAAERVEGTHRLQGVRSVQAYGTLGFALQAHDYHNGSRSQLGVYRITASVDGATSYRWEMESFGFNESRYINAHVDYGERQQSRRWFQRTFRLPGNKLSLYDGDEDGTVSFDPGLTRQLRFQVDDAAGNVASLAFDVSGMEESAPPRDADSASEGYRVEWDRSFKLAREGIRVQLPAEALYESTVLTYDVGESPEGAFSPVHRVHDKNTPVHHRYSLALSAAGLPTRLRAKALVASVDERGEISSVGGDFRNGYVTARPRTFGQFFVTVDTTAPSITPLRFKNGSDLSTRSRLSLRIKDDLSGIASYDGFINEEWVIFEYDAKRNLLRYDFDEFARKGSNDLRLVVRDRKGNESVFEAEFRR
jgi:hypothetical protein